MEQLLNEFTVHRPIAEAWATITDVERIAPCLPGAQLEEIEGDVFRGVVKVKLGPIATAFQGQAQFVERDDTNHRAVLKAAGRDKGGKGNADALITAQAEVVSPEVTKVKVSTDLHVTGKVAQFGRGIMGDVSERLMTQFAENLNTMLATDPATAAAPNEVTAVAAPDADPGADEPVEQPVTAAAPTEPAVRKIQGPAAEPIELSNVAGGAVLKRLLPLLGGLVVLFLVLRRARK